MIEEKRVGFWPAAGFSLLKALLFLTLWACALGGAVAVAIAVWGNNFAARIEGRLALESAGAASLLLATILLARFVDKRGFDTIGFSLPAAPFGLIGGTLIGAAIFVLPLGVLLALGVARIAPDVHGFSWSALELTLLWCLVNVAHQELLVRSYIFQDLWIKFGPLAASIVTTILFVALHFGAIRQGAAGLIAGTNVALASLLLSLAYVRTRQLWLPIGIHFGWNGLQGPVLGIDVTGTDIGLGQWHVFQFPGSALLTGGAMGVEGGLVGLIGPVAGLLVVAMLPRAHASTPSAAAAAA